MKSTNVKKVRCYDAQGKSHLFAEADFIDRVSVYGLCTKNEAVLLVQDSISKKWELPGGGMELDETDAQCLGREFSEETGLKIDGIINFLEEYVSYFFDSTSKAPWRTVRKFYFVASANGVINKDGNGEDVALVKWVKKQEIGLLPMSDKIRKIIQANLP